MSLDSGDFEMELENERSAEVISRLYHQRHDDIHEYAFGILSSDSKGISTIVGISEPYKKSTSSASSVDEEDLLNSVAFQEWNMSRYQSSSYFDEEEEEEEVDDIDEFKEDANNNTTSLGSASREQRQRTLRTSSSSSSLRNSSSPRIIPVTSSPLRRRWSTSSIFGGKSSSPPQVKLTPVMDPDEMEASPPEKWFTSITQIPDRIRQHMADRNRFNIGNVPRDQLKQLYCY